MIRIGNLYDIYGGLLTPKQIKMIELYFLNDLSLAEIAERFNVTRQAVRDVLVRAEHQLEGYEKRLKLVERHSINQKNIQELLRVLNLMKESIITGDASASLNIDQIHYAIDLAQRIKDFLC